MNIHRLDAMHRVQLDSLDYDNAWTPDGLTFEVIRQLQHDAYAELGRERGPEPTAWHLMSDDERAEIRPRRLRPVATPAAPSRTALGASAAGGEAA
ncbi:hypothetical protein [Pseudonocardia sp. N23]|uniref:hypothetical protein n=1 Tax=Pseudonocardia sp. N23 TaxID=1987376 RepID=UPI000BFE124E|nr:hypothetical protein [Pseudonocardia sp. N23]GAY12441.1 hypothetical protein TOK_0837 [Pseudonocardia sp. N23]